MGSESLFILIRPLKLGQLTVEALWFAEQKISQSSQAPSDLLPLGLCVPSRGRSLGETWPPHAAGVLFLGSLEPGEEPGCHFPQWPSSG